MKDACRIFYRCVDWNWEDRSGSLSEISRIFYRCVDWNNNVLWILYHSFVASFTDAWIETAVTMGFRYLILSRIFYRCVDWNWKMSMTLKSNVVASFTDAWIETIMLRYHLQLQWVASFTDAWIETLCHLPGNMQEPRRIFYRCVDWNYQHQHAIQEAHVASFTDAWIETHWQNDPGTNFVSHLLQMRGLKL